MPTQKMNLWRAALEDHKHVGKELIPPFQQIGPQMEQIFWPRDLLPEFLWIDSLTEEYGEPAAVALFNDFLAAADRFNPHPKRILDGTISAFNLIPTGERKKFVEELGPRIQAAVVRPFGDVLSLYAECPMIWMAPELSSDRSSAIEAVRSAFLRLLPGKDSYAGFCRALPLNRFFAHNKVFISDHLKETIEAIKEYPKGDRYRAETFARSVHIR